MKKDRILFFILGLLVASTTVYAAYKYQAGEVGYTPSNSNFSVDNVEDAIEGLYDKITKPDAVLVVGNQYQMGGFNWTCVESINGGYVLQSHGMTTGTWPGYKLAENYDGSKSYGDANTLLSANIDGDNIANYDDITSNFYKKWKDVEISSSYGSGLYLVGLSKLGGTGTNATAGSGQYYNALKVTVTNHISTLEAAWSGYRYSNSAWYVYCGSGGKVDGCDIRINGAQYSTGIIAPAFNLDASKVYLDGIEIKKK